jgi:hypothetical protein
MGNEAQYRDLSLSNPFLPGFSEIVVILIERVSMAIAFMAGLFGILYFTLAPSVATTAIEISRVQLAGYNCKMISGISRSINPFPNAYSSLPSREALMNFSDNVVQAGKAISIRNANFPPLPDCSMGADCSEPLFKSRNFLYDQVLEYENVQFDYYDDCFAQAQFSCTYVDIPPEGSCRNFDDSYNRDFYPDLKSSISCKSLKGKLQLAPKTSTGSNMQIKYSWARLLNETLGFGECNNQVVMLQNLSTCSNVQSQHCRGLTKFISSFERLLGNFITPKSICLPFVDNPPYLCKKTESLSVPSILSQSLAFTTSALALANTLFFYAAKMHHKWKASAQVADNSGIEPEHSAANVAKYDKPETIP